MLRKFIDVHSALATVFTGTLLALKALHIAHTVVTVISVYLHKNTNSMLFIMDTVSVYWRSELELNVV